MAEAKQSKPKTKKIKKAEEAEVAVDTATPEEEVLASDTEQTSEAPKAEAKAGKRSPKAIKEAEEKQAKAERKTKDTDDAPKPAKKPARSRVERSGKKFREASKLVDKTRSYSPSEAVKLATETSITKFDATVELHVNLGVDPKQADQNVRDTVVLPAGTGKTLRVAVFAEGDDVEKAKKAGADLAGADELQAQLEKEEVNFDILVATPAMMSRLSKYARFLGPRGLMPNPKSGTVTADVAKAVSEAKAGRVEYRVDGAGIIHMGIGKVSFGPEKLNQNLEAALASIKAARPASLKGIYVKAAYVSTTMGPSIKLAEF